MAYPVVGVKLGNDREECLLLRDGCLHCARSFQTDSSIKGEEISDNEFPGPDIIRLSLSGNLKREGLLEAVLFLHAAERAGQCFIHSFLQVPIAGR